jgi:8-oxo-dGTP pyrophosphatase MutT (NUDIX family)
VRDRPGRPRVVAGAGVVITAAERILIIKQKYSGKVDWGFTGGALEAGESLEECAIREAFEELGLRVRLLRLIAVGQFFEAGQLHGIGLTFLAEPEPWPRTIHFGTQDETEFLDYRWVSRQEFESLSGAPDHDFWRLPWPPDVREPLLYSQRR